MRLSAWEESGKSSRPGGCARVRQLLFGLGLGRWACVELGLFSCATGLLLWAYKHGSELGSLMGLYGP